MSSAGLEDDREMMLPANRDRHNRNLIAVYLAIAFWISDSIIHFSGYGESRFEFIPTDFNELWMRTLICVLIVGYGALSGRHFAVLADTDNPAKYLKATNVADMLSHE